LTQTGDFSLVFSAFLTLNVKEIFATYLASGGGGVSLKGGLVKAA
jgi:hypothetical protein